MGGGAADNANASAAPPEAPTRELQWELGRREGVHSYRLGPEAAVEITMDGAQRYAGGGPMTVTVNQPSRRRAVFDPVNGGRVDVGHPCRLASFAQASSRQR